MDTDLEKLFSVIEKAREYTENIHLYGCSIFRTITKEELAEVNQILKQRFSILLTVVSQEEEALLTIEGCYKNIDYPGTICIFIGGGGSIELVFVRNQKIIDKKYYGFGVVDITRQFSSLKEDIPTCTFDTVYQAIEQLIQDIEISADILILAGGDHFYWYHNAAYSLLENTLYQKENQPYMLTIEMSNRYDHDAFVTSLERIRNNSDNPVWFDGSRAMKVITNFISHQVHAKYIIPTKINMEDGLKNRFFLNQ